jgi:NAD(P)-dependent dehydrogenase (short-subunit alcohol dehydrogenase family)
MANAKLAVVTGGNRGIGLEVCRQLAEKGYHVVLAARDLKKGEAAARSLKGEVTAMELDVSSAQSIERFSQELAQRYGRLDVLVNNAGVMLDTGSALEVKADIIRRTIETNTLGAYQLLQRLLPLMKKGGYGRVVNVSSGMGQLSDMNGGYPGYRISKTALNAVTRIFADEMEGTGILINSVCPGWVKTDMGGAEAERGVAEGADTLVWLATLPDNGPTGGFFRDREPIAW